MNQDDPLRPYEVFEGSAWHAGLLKSILSDHEIESIISDPFRLPWNTQASVNQSARVFVAYQDFERARVIVDEFQQNLLDDNENNSADEH